MGKIEIEIWILAILVCFAYIGVRFLIDALLFKKWKYLRNETEK